MNLALRGCGSNINRFGLDSQSVSSSEEALPSSTQVSRESPSTCQLRYRLSIRKRSAERSEVISRWQWSFTSVGDYLARTIISHLLVVSIGCLRRALAGAPGSGMRSSVRNAWAGHQLELPSLFLLPLTHEVGVLFLADAGCLTELVVNPKLSSYQILGDRPLQQQEYPIRN